MSRAPEADDVAHDQARPRVAPDPAAASARCRDLDVWHRAVIEAGDLALRRTDGRLRVSSAHVKLVLLALRSFMDGPTRPDPGANAYPGRELLARLLELSEDQVEQALRAGVAHGYLVQTARGHTGQRATFAAAMPAEVADVLPIDEEESPGRDQASTPRALVGTTESPGRDQARPPQYLQPPPPAREEGHRQPPLVASVRGEGRGPSKSRAELEDVSASRSPVGADRRSPGVVDQALDELARNELKAQPAGTVRDPDAWRRAKVRRLADDHRQDLQRLAADHRPTTGRELLEIRDRHAAETRRLESAATLGRNYAGVLASADELDDLPALRGDPQALEAARAAWRAAQEVAS